MRGGSRKTGEIKRQREKCEGKDSGETRPLRKRKPEDGERDVF